VVLLVGWLALVALHLWLVREATSPGQGPGDEWGYLGSARYLAGDPHTYVMPFFPYFTYGYSIVLAPWSACSTIRTTVPGHQGRELGAGGATFPLLYLFARCVLEARRRPALAAAAMGSLVWPLMRHPG
jgi:hypothetical protein